MDRAGLQGIKPLWTTGIHHRRSQGGMKARCPPLVCVFCEPLGLDVPCREVRKLTTLRPHFSPAQ